MIHKGLESVGRDGGGEQSQNQNGTADSADAPGKRAERSFPILADAQAGEPPLMPGDTVGLTWADGAAVEVEP